MTVTNETLKTFPQRRPDLFIPPSDETAYLQEHDIFLERLSNGAAIVTSPYLYQDAAQGYINLHFSSGALNDPPGKSGLTHLIEHVISNEPGVFAHKSGGASRYNAQTSAASLTVQMSGLANPTAEYRNTGIWPLISVVVDRLKNSTSMKISGDLVATELRTISREIDMYGANHEHQVTQHLGRLIFGSGNAINTNVLGTLEDLSHISPEDVERMLQSLFSPIGLVARVETEEHKMPVHGIMHNEIKHLIEQLQIPQHQLPVLNTTAYELTNTEIIVGDYYEIDTKLGNRATTVCFAWPFLKDPQSQSTLALDLYISYVRGFLKEQSRAAGISYRANAYTVTPLERASIFVVRMDIEKNGNLKKDSQKIERLLRQYVLGGHALSSFNEFIREQNHYRKALPLAKSCRAADAVDGLREFGRVINTDRIMEMHDHVEGIDLNNWQDYFSQNSCVTAVIGDLST